MSRDDIHWSPRVPKWKLQRLYESEAQGMLDEDLLEDVGLTLLLRCEDILAIEEAKQGRVWRSPLFQVSTLCATTKNDHHRAHSQKKGRSPG